MIYRQNWLDVRDYLRYMERVRQNDPETVKRARGHLRHLLEWSDDAPFSKARDIDPTFPVYLLTARSDGRDKTLAPASVIKCLAFTRQFFQFARAEWPRLYRTISDSWIESLQPPRMVNKDSRLHVRQYFSFENVLRVAGVSTETLRQERGKVAVCMLFLSGMRADALASIPISCVDVANRNIMQLPEFGVRTKNRKAAVTHPLEIPELLEVIERWDSRVRSLPPNALWYSTLSRDGMTITPNTQAFVGRHNVIERDVRMICKLSGIEYLSPHKLRHGHIVYARSRAHSVEEAKAISQNVMHSNSIITDQIYGELAGDQVKNIISNLGSQPRQNDDKLARLLALLEANPELLN